MSGAASDDGLAYLDCRPLEGGAYGQWFTDAGPWRPYVQAVARRHGLAAPGRVSVGVPGSHPVFLAEAGYVVKFYAPHWPHDFDAEWAVYEVMAGARGPGRGPGIAVPRLMARGALFREDGRWPWPYLVLTRVPGRSVGELRDVLAAADVSAVAAALGPVVRGLHALPVSGRAAALAGAWRERLADLCRTAPDRLRQDGGWADSLIEGLPVYVRQALDARPAPAPRLVHADLTQDHVLLAPREGTDGGSAGRWELSGLIDFADAQVADPAYELVALHVDLFRCDRGLLRTFLRACGPAGEGTFGTDWRPRATAYVLVFPFALGGPLAHHVPDWGRVRTPRDLEEALWPGPE